MAFKKSKIIFEIKKLLFNMYLDCFLKVFRLIKRIFKENWPKITFSRCSSIISRNPAKRVINYNQTSLYKSIVKFEFEITLSYIWKGQYKVKSIILTLYHIDVYYKVDHHTLFKILNRVCPPHEITSSYPNPSPQGPLSKTHTID